MSAPRVPQIWANLQARGTGQLSLITYALNSVGAAARIFTSIQEKAGPAMLRGAIISECRTGLQDRAAGQGWRLVGYWGWV